MGRVVQRVAQFGALADACGNSISYTDKAGWNGCGRW